MSRALALMILPLALAHFLAVNPALSLAADESRKSAGSTALLSNIRASDRSQEKDANISFGRDIQPILSNRCFKCHGPDSKTREAGLRLDRPEGMYRKLESGVAAVVPGNPDKSELLQRVLTHDDDLRMPPADTGDRLPPAQVQLIRKWIERGARWQGHWAFVSPLRPRTPDVADSRWTRNPVDHFIRSKLESAGLAPSKEADRRTLIRRLTFDLIGLPPTIEEVNAFLADSRHNAYERLVDRLLASPRYGERMAQDWLDQARYADTTGYSVDRPRTAWLYRDWVIDALNQNMPFDRFTIEQLAGDMLPKASVAQKIATGFHRNSMQALGANPRVEEFRVKGIKDRLDTTARVWLGLTLSCAECHNHKFDPILQKEYYQLFAIFNNVPHYGKGFAVRGPRLQMLPKSLRLKRDRIRHDIASAKAELASVSMQEVEARRKAWERNPVLPKISISARLVEHWPLGGDLANALEKRSPAIVDRGELAWSGDGPADGLRSIRLTGDQSLRVSKSAVAELKGDVTFAAWIKTTDGIGDIVSAYDWRAGQRSFVFGVGGEGEANTLPGRLFAWFSAKTDPFQGVVIYSSQAVNDGRWHHVAVVFEPGKSIRLVIDGVTDDKVTIQGDVPSQIAVSNRDLAIGAGYKNSKRANAFHFKGQLAGVRIYRGAVKRMAAVCGIPPAIRRVLSLPRPNRSGRQQEIVEAFYRSIDPATNKLGDRIAFLKQQDAALQREAIDAQVMAELPQPRASHVQIRGDYLIQGDRVFPAVPKFLPALPKDQPANRLSFARWLVDGKNPLTARVTVNRAWQHFFGNGIITTSEDFGWQGEWPSHPQLLDWLAVEFVDSGWNMKALHRLIVTSATYRQSSAVTAELKNRDPGNRLLACGPRFRLPAEQVRDNALAVSGLLTGRIGGASVFPVQPANLWEDRGLTGYGAGTWKESSGGDLYRRTLYVFWRRMVLYPSLLLFNAPTRETCIVQRSTTNTPLQALVTLNDPVFLEAARVFAERIMTQEPGSTKTRIDYAFQRCLSRNPMRSERDQFVSFYERMRRRYLADRQAALAVVDVGSAPRTKGLDPQELAAWTMIASVLLNLDETITKR